MAKSISLSHISLLFLRPKPTITLSIRATLSSFLSSNLKKTLIIKPFSTTSTPYPLQYDMIISRPTQSSLPQPRRRQQQQLPHSKPTDSRDSLPDDSELGFDDWVDKKLTPPSPSPSPSPSPTTSSEDNGSEMDKSKRKYYSKRRKRMYGSDSDDDSNRRDGDDYVELKPEVVELRTLHKKEEELYFYDTFAYPWEKEKHYKMVYQLEKKFFPDQCFDKAFLEPGQSNANDNSRTNKARKTAVKSGEKKGGVVGGGDEKGLVFFEDEREEEGGREMGPLKDIKVDVTEKKVEEFFKCLKKVPNKDAVVGNLEPFVATKTTGLPPKWDSPGGTVVLVNKPKGV